MGESGKRVRELLLTGLEKKKRAGTSVSKEPEAAHEKSSGLKESCVLLSFLQASSGHEGGYAAPVGDRKLVARVVSETGTEGPLFDRVPFC